MYFRFNAQLRRIIVLLVQIAFIMQTVELKQPLNISLWVVLKSNCIRGCCKNLYWDQMCWLEYKPLDFACVLLPCCISVKIGGESSISSCNLFPLATVFPLTSIHYSCSLLTLPVCCHVWWYKMVFLYQLSLCSNFGLQILVRQNHCRVDQHLVMVGRLGENKCMLLLLYILLCRILLTCGSYYKSSISICSTVLTSCLHVFTGDGGRATSYENNTDTVFPSTVDKVNVLANGCSFTYPADME